MSQKPMSPHRTIAKRVRELRRQRGIRSARELADLMSEIGFPWDRSIVANLESGRRATVSVAELFGLAYVLNVSPMHLLMPDDGQELYEYVPGMAANARPVREWVAGRRPIHGQNLNLFIGAVPGDDPDDFWRGFPGLRAELQGQES